MRRFTIAMLAACSLLGYAHAHVVTYMPHTSVHSSSSRTNIGSSKPRYTSTTVVVGTYNTPSYYDLEGHLLTPASLGMVVPSDAERYREATGGVLPSAHGNILLPPTTANGDFTYIWPTAGGE